MSRARWVPVLLVAVLCFGCTPVPPPPRIVAPVDRTQAPGIGQIPVSIARNGAPRSSLLVELVTGTGSAQRVRDIMARLANSGDSLVTTLGPADLVQGPSELRLGQRGSGGGIKALGRARFSGEPSIEPRRRPSARAQKSALRTGGALVDTCGGAPCLAP